MSTAVSSRPAKAHYHEDQIRSALLAVAVADGSAYRARDELKDKGIAASQTTVERWRDRTYRELYQQIRSELQNSMQARHGSEMEDLITRGMETTRRYWDRANEVLPDLDPRDVPGGLRNVGVTLGIQVQRGLELREKPGGVPPEPSRSLEEVVRALVSLKVATIVEPGASAIDMPDAEVVPDPPSNGAPHG